MKPMHIFFIVVALIVYLYQEWKKFNSHQPKKNTPEPKREKPAPMQQTKRPGQLTQRKSPMAGRQQTHPQDPNVKPVGQPSPQKPTTTLEELLGEFEVKIPGKGESSKSGRPGKRLVEKRAKEVDNYVDEEQVAEDNKRKRLAMEEKQHSIFAGDEEKDASFQPYGKGKGKESVYHQLLKSPDGAKTAFVLSEIFNRKYS